MLLLAIGFGAGRISISLPAHRDTPPVREEVTVAPSVDSAGSSKPASALAIRQAIESLTALSEDSKGRWTTESRKDLVDELAKWSGDPAEIVDVVIDAMSDRELRSVITSLTGLTESDVEDVHDLRAFARRASSVAMDNIVRFDEDAATESLPPIDFSHDPSNMIEFTTDRFVGDERIFAVFQSDSYSQDEVFVKWYRSDKPQILLYDRYPIQRETDQNYVWLENKEGWPKGEYTVEFYTADGAMARVAEGQYTVDPTLAGPFGH